MILACVSLFAVFVIKCGPIKPSANGEITRAISNARQIFFGLGLYGNDNNGKYPDGLTANEAFRKLVSTKNLDSEVVFGCPNSLFVPDGNLGSAPLFEKAIQPGENHWMYIFNPEGSSAAGNAPLLIEAPDISTGVPLWHPEWEGTKKPGRTWSGRRVVVCLNDGSVSTWRVDGTSASSKLRSGGSVIDFTDSSLELRHIEYPLPKTK